MSHSAISMHQNHLKDTVKCKFLGLIPHYALIKNILREYSGHLLRHYKAFEGQGWRQGVGNRAPYAALPDLDRAALLVQLQLVVRIKVCSMAPSFLSHNLSLKGLRNDNRQEGLADVFQNRVLRPSCESSSPYARKK